MQLQLFCDPQAAQFQQRTFKLKVAEEVYNQEARIKVSIRDTEPIDFVDESAVRLCPTLGSLHEGVAVNSWIFRPFMLPIKEVCSAPHTFGSSPSIYFCVGAAGLHRQAAAGRAHHAATAAAASAAL